MSLKDTLQIQKKYFNEYSKEIAIRNLKLMATVCYCGISMYIFYYIITYLFFPKQKISLAYGIIVPILFLFLYRTRNHLKNANTQFKNTQLLTVLMYLIVMAYAIILSVFAHPELNAVYYPLFLMLGPVMFILPLHQQILINIASFGVFSYCIVNVKVETLWMHDLFESFTALLFSFIVILLMTQFRVQSDDLKSRYYSLSIHDGLTGILNKTAGIDIIKDYIHDSIHNEKYALILLDIDDFKNINDTYGHASGDKVLKAFGKLLADTFEKNAVVSRYGGDEFLVLMKRVSRKDCEAKIKLFEQIVSRKIIHGDIKISTSIGIYIGTCGNEQFETALENADRALYKVKQNGKNAHLVYVERK